MYAFQQDVPINADVYAHIRGGLGDEPPAGLIAHLAIEREDGTLRYIDIWRSAEEAERFTDERLHPVVGRVLAEAGIRPDGEPPRHPLRVVHLWGSVVGTVAPAQPA